nr:MAG TPA: capsid protein [Genomoviridae sp.]
MKGRELFQPFVIENDLGVEVTYTAEDFYRNLFGNDVGVNRPLFDLASYYGNTPDTTKKPLALANLYAVLFEGTSIQFTDQNFRADWLNVIDAKTDASRVTIKYDKTVTIRSGNDEGTQRQYTRYHPMKKNLIYENQESGGDVVFSNYSTSGKPGMGDYYVVDFFQCRYGADADAGSLIFDPRSTLYWHER